MDVKNRPLSGRFFTSMKIVTRSGVSWVPPAEPAHLRTAGWRAVFPHSFPRVFGSGPVGRVGRALPYSATPGASTPPGLGS